MEKSVTLRLEAIGLYSQHPYGGMDSTIKNKEFTPWVAEIESFHPKWIFSRNFLQGLCDWTESNSKGSRGVYYVFHCFPGSIYEAWHKSTWKKEHRYFFRVSGGKIIKMKKIEVIQCLSCI